MVIWTKHFTSFVTYTTSTGGGGGGGSSGGYILGYGPNYLAQAPIVGPAPVPVLVPVTIPATPKYLFYRSLGYGSRSEDVRELQQYMNKNINANLKLDGIFGPLTKAALIRFQELHYVEILKPYGLKKGTGFFGPKTRAYINSHQ